MNKYYGTVLQILGGVTVLFSIIKNLNVFRSKTVWQLVIEWVNDFPTRDRGCIEVEDSASTSDYASSVDISQETLSAHTIEERVNAIECDIIRIKENQKQEVHGMKLEIENLKSNIENNKNHTYSKINELGTSLKTAMAGDIQSPIFGVVLATVGTLISLFS